MSDGVMLKEVKSTLSKEEMRERIMAFEEKLGQVEGAVKGKALDAVCKLKHTFVHGMYVREMLMPQGMYLTSKIHKTQHPYFMLSGDVSIITDTGAVRMKGPCYGVSEPGIKRIAYVHEESVWVTCHLNLDECRDLEEIEDKVIAKSFEELLPNKEEFCRLKEA